MWQDTHDALLDAYRAMYNTCNMVVHAPPFIFVSFPYIYYARARYVNALRSLAQKQCEIYKSAGVVVTLIMDHNKGNNKRPLPVGLQFSVGGAPAVSAGTGVADELEKLGKLHDEGKLSSDEYAQAKLRVLSGDSKS